MTIPPIDAELALAEIRIRREQVVGANLVPAWFWVAIGGLMVMFVAAVESARPVFVAVGSVVYALGLAGLILAVVRRGRVQVRPSLIGARGALAIAGFTLVLVAAGVGLGLLLEAAGAGWPATIGCVPVAIGLAAGGPLLMSYLRRVMLSRPLAGSR
ncbi:hypothetical protein BJ973_003950 [Actinoplanes tereljensis]|uniref:Transmembrane protein n=1 Tax=Paractinoplanes tereljensis TaxID=571912 RepID=A0A919TWY9_9ACTN|nr:hypothetical protein [Actinoplanes tereljensis]GIF25671.1 hypothetical protein Ate02nite_84010 [Actinoplanes tereljensis]